MFKSNSNPSTWYSVTSSIKTWKIFRLIFCDEQFSLKMNQQPFSQPSRRFLWFFRKKQFIIIIIIILMIYLVLYYIMFMIKTIVIKTLDLAFLHVWKKTIWLTLCLSEELKWFMWHQKTLFHFKMEISVTGCQHFKVANG